MTSPARYAAAWGLAYGLIVATVVIAL